MTITIRIAADDTDRLACESIRQSVFVLEQGVPADLEWDDLDDVAVHFLACDAAGVPVGTARLIDKQGLAKIGRVAVLAEARGRSIGRQLMHAVLDEARRRGFASAVLDSQVHVIPFYERLGFVAQGPVFIDAGIPHRRMLVKL